MTSSPLSGSSAREAPTGAGRRRRRTARRRRTRTS
jgi:hypothetical protein